MILRHMKLRDIVKVVDGTLITELEDPDLEVIRVASSDLMSDVLAFSVPHALLLTGLANSHVIVTAEVADIAAIIFVRGKTPTDGMVSLATEKRIPLITSPHCMFEMCGRLYGAGLRGCDVN